MRQIATTTAAMAFVLAGVLHGRADNVGDIRQGQALAEKQCLTCHALKSTKAPDAAEAPPFEAIANMDSATILSIRVWLRTAHRNKTMPSIMLSEDEVDSLASYILSLRAK